jgi:hypothetical protein
MAREMPLIVSRPALDQIQRSSYAEGYRKAIEDVTGCLLTFDDEGAALAQMMELLVELPDPR